MPRLIPLLQLLLPLSAPSIANGFIIPTSITPFLTAKTTTRAASRLQMAQDPVTYLRTEWVSAALCTNQTPREADKVLQLGCEDGRIVNFVPRTVREIITSSAEPKDSLEGGGLTVSCERQLKQMAERRASGISIQYSNQPADDLFDVPSSSVDIVVSFHVAQRMAENGLNWKRSVEEAGRVLKPGGRFLFVESNMVGSESYLDHVVGLSEKGGVEIKPGLVNDDGGGEMMEVTPAEGDKEEEENLYLFEEVGYDQVDMVLQPHIAGVAIKAADADLTSAEKALLKQDEEKDRLAELSLNVFERGIKRRKRKKKKKTLGDEEEL